MRSCLLSLFLVAYLAERHLVKAASNTSTPGRIQYGDPVKKGSYSYFVRLAITDKGGETFTCGGFLYRPNVVVTAAHCASDDDNRINVKQIRVYSNGDGGIEGRKPRQVYGYRVPSTWGTRDLKGDVMILKTFQELDLLKTMRKNTSMKMQMKSTSMKMQMRNTSLKMQMKSMSNEYEEYEDSRLLASQSNTGRLSGSEYTLLEAKVPMLSSKVSNEFAKKESGSMMEVDHFGAGYDKEHQDACVGDSGGPIIHKLKTNKGNSYPVVIGVVSYGFTKCGEKNSVGFYTSIPYHRRWIDDTIMRDKWVKL
eukprot:jgi/Picre1/31691/NNA_007042.t1